MKHLKVNASKQEKLKLIKSILNGTMSFEHLRAPQHHIIEVENNTYRFWLSNTVMNEAEFEQWKATLRPQDTLILLKHQPGNDPLIEDEPIVEKTPKNRPEIDLPIEAPAEQPKAPRVPVMDAEPEPEPDEVVLVAVPKRAGKLSEYGETWGPEHKDIFYS